MDTSRYLVIKQIHEGKYTLLYRAFDTKEKQQVILKSLKPEFLSSAVLKEKLRNEYQLLKKIHSKNIITAIEIVDNANEFYLILEDFSNYNLAQILQEKRFTLAEALSLAIKITEAVADIHHYGIIHGNLRPENILIIEEKNEIKIVDFFNIYQHNDQSNLYMPLPITKQTLAFCAPEQTDLINREIDYRTDYYALGLILYTLLMGHPPFVAKNYKKLLRLIVTKKPKLSKAIAIKIQSPLSEIISHLLAKLPEKRYQNISSIQKDLEYCLKQTYNNSIAQPFFISRKRAEDRFNISQRLYGRKKVLKQLKLCIEGMANNANQIIILKSKAEGMGISSLVKELGKIIISKNGYLVHGKFLPGINNEPFAPFIETIKDLLQQITRENSQQIQSLYKLIAESVSNNKNILIKLIPELKNYINFEPKLEKESQFDLIATQNALNLTLTKLILTLAKYKSPVVIFIDNWQLANSASHKLLKLLCAHPESSNLFIILGFKHELVSSVKKIIDIDISYANCEIKSFTLKPLTLKSIKKLIHDTIATDAETIEMLAKHFLSLSGGNIIFIKYLLKYYYEENIISYDVSKNIWVVNEQRLRTTSLPNTLLDVIQEQLKNIPSFTLYLLQVAACLGEKCDLGILSALTDKPANEIYYELCLPQDKKFIRQIATSFKNYEEIKFQFSNSYIMQAIYYSSTEEQRKLILNKINRLFHKNILNLLKTDIIKAFSLPPIHNSHCFVEEHDKSNIALLNYLEGVAANNKFNFNKALSRFNIAIANLPVNSWNEQYDFSLNLYCQACSAAFLVDQNQTLEEFNEIILKNCQDPLYKISIYEQKIYKLTQQNKSQLALSLALEVLKDLGLKLPNKASLFYTAIEYLKTKFLLSRKSMHSLLQLPLMQDKRNIAIIHMLDSAIVCSYLINPNLIPILVFKTLQLSLKNGNLPIQSAISYALYGAIQCNIGNIATGAQYGQLALACLDKFQLENAKPRIIVAINSLILNQYEAIENINDTLLKTFKDALNNGNIESACYSILIYCVQAFSSGNDLSKLSADLKKYVTFMQAIQQQPAYEITLLFLEACRNLTGESKEKNHLKDLMEEKATHFKNTNNLEISRYYRMYYYLKIVLSYIFQDYEAAYENILLEEDYLPQTKASYTEHSAHYFRGLVYLVYYQELANKDRGILQAAHKEIRILEKLAKQCPSNHLHRYYLLSAEYNKIHKKTSTAAHLYDQAIELARKNKFIMDEAIANELTAKFYLSLGKEHITKIYFKDAYLTYEKWHASAKLAQLMQIYPHLLNINKLSITSSFSNSFTSSTRPVINALDIASVMKASQALSREIILSELLKKLMQIVIENAGAQKGLLLLKTDEEWLIEAQTSIYTKEISTLKSIKIQDQLPKIVIQKVLHTKKPFVIGDAINVDAIKDDYYIQHNKPKSILCLPLINQDQLTGILYLENNLTTDAFNKDRLELMTLLSEQAIVAIDNAKLYRYMKMLNETFAKFVPKQFLQLLNKKNISQINPADAVQQEMAVLFCDIKNFTSLTPTMAPQERMDFLNLFLSYMEPAITQYQGFIDKYMGDGIMALYPYNVDDAVQSAIAMLQALNRFNQLRKSQLLSPIKIGIGINCGRLMLGMLGDQHRMEGSVISDVVNSSARLQHLTKDYNVSLLITEAVYSRLKNPAAYVIRKLDSVRVKGKLQVTTIYEVFDNDAQAVILGKYQTAADFQKAISLWQEKKYHEARDIFKNIITINPQDEPAKYFLEACERALANKSVPI